MTDNRVTFVCVACPLTAVGIFLCGFPLGCMSSSQISTIIFVSFLGKCSLDRFQMFLLGVLICFFFLFFLFQLLSFMCECTDGAAA